jgi:S1-C subfamily serine protease
VTKKRILPKLGKCGRRKDAHTGAKDKKVRRIFLKKENILKKQIVRASIVVWAFLLVPAALYAGMAADLKPAVVNLQVSYSKYFGLGEAGRFSGTGFIADKDKGLIITNRHVAGEFPSQIKITFLDGESTLGRVEYYDATHDFSIVSFDPASVSSEIEEVRLGDFFSLKTGDEVTLIGNNEGEEYSVKKGVVVDLVKNKGDRHSLTFQTSFDRTGGSSGSPVFNQQGEVVGLHFKGTDTSSFELPVNYIKDKLTDLAREKAPVRGEIGVQIDLVKTADAVGHLGLPQDVADAMRSDFGDLKYCLMVKSVIRTLPAEKALQAGDVIYSVDGAPIGDRLYRFDKIVDKRTGGELTLEFYRRDKKMTARIPVLNAEEYKITRFATFAGGTFHPLTPEIRLDLDIASGGVYLSQAELGSTFGSVGYSSSRNPDRKGVVVQGINGQPVRDLDDFIRLASALKHNQKISMAFKDQFLYAPATVELLILDLHTSPLTVFSLNSATREWETEKAGGLPPDF